MKQIKYLFRQIIIPCLIVYAIFVACLYLFQNSLVYVPPKLSLVDLTPLNKFQKISVPTEDGLTLSAYYSPPQKGMPIILKFHGNGSHPASDYQRLKELSVKGYGFVLAEYRGYAGNEGTPSENGLYKDAEAYYKWIKVRPQLKAAPLVVFGSSLGTGVAVDLASRNKIEALVLEVPFDNMPEVSAFHYPYILFVRNLTKNKYRSDLKIKNVKAPVLFLLAGQDEVVSLATGRHLAQLANKPKEAYVFQDAGHVNVFRFGATKVLEKFLKENVHG